MDRQVLAQRIVLGVGLGQQLVGHQLDDRLGLGVLVLGLAPLPDHTGKPAGQGQQNEHRRGGQGRVATAPHRRADRRTDRTRPDRLALPPSRQVVGQFLGAGVPAARLFFQALLADDLQAARYLRIESRGGLGRLAPYLVERLDQRGAGERCPAGEQRIQDRTQAVDIGRRRERARARVACSGDMYDGVPIRAFECVISEPASSRLASPKSVTCGAPCSSSRIFAGFRSRWRIPR